MRFSWDEEKNQRNIRKHGVSFEMASEVFDDPHAMSLQDESCDGEERWLTTGVVRGVVVLLLVHTWKEQNDEEDIRIISARKATRLEREEYENQYKKL
jgi:uncharacterized protein